MGKELRRSPHQEDLLLQEEKLLLTFVDLYRSSGLSPYIRGVIHNLNGHLQVVSMHIEVMQDLLTRSGEKTHPSVSGKVTRCLGEVEKMKALLEALLEREGQEEQQVLQTIDLNELIEGELSFLRNHFFFKHQVKLEKGLSSALPPLKGYPIDFRKSLHSLLLNAVEAMEVTPQKVMTVVTETRGDSVEFMVRDTGCGISEEVKPLLFTPFFTTKGEGHYGLGLFMARELLTPYGASFRFSCEEGRTTVSVDFPVTSGCSSRFFPGKF